MAADLSGVSTADLLKALQDHPDIAGPQKDPSEYQGPSDTRRGTYGFGDEMREQGAMLGYGDEISAGISTGFDTLQRVRQGQAPQLSSDYDKELKFRRAQRAEWESKHPGATYVAPALGGIGSVGPGTAVQAMRALPTYAQQIWQGAKTGAGIGAVTGFGSGEGGFENRAKSAAGEATLGAVFGAATPPVIDAAAGTLRAAGNAIRQRIWPRTAAESTQLGRDYVQRIFEQSGLSQEDFQRAIESVQGKPVTAAELIGPRGEINLMALARRSGTTADELQAQLRQRGAERPARVSEDMALASGIHPEAAKGNIQGIVKAGQEQAAPLYKEAFARPGPPTWSPRIQGFTDSPELRAGLARGIKLQRQRSLADDKPFNPSDYGVTMDPTTGEPIFTWPGQGEKLVLPLRTLDAGKRGLDAMIEDFRDKTTHRLNMRNEEVKNLVDIRKAYTAAVDQVAPPIYRRARAVAGDYLSAEDAFNFGQKAIFDKNLTEADFGRGVANLTPADNRAFKGGIANRLFELSQNGALRPAQFLTPRVRTKLDMALGPNQAELFIRSLEREAMMKGFEQRAVPAAGSQTQPLAQAMKEQDQFGQSDAALSAQEALTSGKGPRGMVQHFAENWLARKGSGVMARLRTPGLDEPARNEAGRILRGVPQEGEPLLPPPPSAPGIAANQRILPRLFGSDYAARTSNNAAQNTGRKGSPGR